MSGFISSLESLAPNPANESVRTFQLRQPKPLSCWHDLSPLELVALGIVAVAVLISGGAAAAKLLALYDPLLPLNSAVHQLGGTLDVERRAGHDPQLHIDLHARPVTDLKFLHDARYFRVAELDLSDTPLDDVQLQHLTRLLIVRSLKLGNTRISDAGLEALTRVHGLSELSLRGTQITKTGLATILGCPNLSAVDLSATAISQRDVDNLPVHTVRFRLAADK